MFKNIFLLLFSLLFLQCSNTDNALKYDENKIAILNVSKHETLQKNNSFELTNEDIIKIDKLINSSVNNYNSEQIKLLPKYQAKHSDMNITSENVTINLDNYKRQYIPYVNSNGERIVWIYCMIKRYAHSDWKKELGFAAGGGSNFFRVNINLSNNTYSNFMINGPA